MSDPQIRQFDADWVVFPIRVITAAEAAAHNLLSRGQEVAVEVDESQAVSVVLRPGEASLHHVKLVHGSEPNRSDDRRIGVSVRYIPTHVRQTLGPRDSASLVRGTDAHRHFHQEPTPGRDLARTSHTGHGLRGAVAPTGQECRAARCRRIWQAA